MQDQQWMVPHGTAFALTLDAQDASVRSIDEITIGPHPDEAPPWFLAHAPSAKPTFAFPSSANQTAGGFPIDDRPPDTHANLEFLAMGRDTHGGIGFALDKVTVTDDGPLTIVAQQGWQAPGNVRVTWQTNGLENSPLGATVVDIWISHDDGRNWCQVMTHVPNNGLATNVPLEPQDVGDQVRVRLTVPGQIFFAD